MEKQGNPHPSREGHGIWTGVVIAGGLLAAVLAIFATQAYAAGITVSSATINDGTTVYPTVYEADWTVKATKAWTITPNVTSGTVTTVGVSGISTGGGPRAIRVQLLDGAATIISTGCTALSATPWSVTVDVTDVTFSSVARVKALGGSSPCP